MRGRRSDRDGGGDSAPRRASRASILSLIRWRSRSAAPRVRWNCEGEAEGSCADACARIASAGRRPILCACSIARCRKTSRSSIRCLRSSIIYARSDRAFRHGAGASGRRGAFAYEVRPRLVRGLGLLHAHDVRNHAWGAGRAEFGAGRRALRRSGGSVGLEGARAGNWILHRRRSPGDERWKASTSGIGESLVDVFLAPMGDAADPHAGDISGASSRRPACRWSAASKQAEASARSRQQTRRAVCADCWRQRNRCSETYSIERHGDRPSSKNRLPRRAKLVGTRSKKSNNGNI